MLGGALPALQKRSTPDLAAEVGQFARPFSLLLGRIQDSYNSLAIPSESAQDPRVQIQKHFQLLRWYVDKHLSTQAILLAREWVISALCVSEGIQDYRVFERRKSIEEQLGAMISKSEEASSQLDQPVARHVTDPKSLSEFWSKLTTYRNDLAHVQMREKPIRGEKLEKFALEELIPKLRALFPAFTQP